MRKIRVEEKLRKKLIKLLRKDRRRHEALMGKVEELRICEDPDHYKNLRAPLQHLKEVHVNSHFVLTFKYLKKEDVIALHDFDHHDKISK